MFCFACTGGIGSGKSYTVRVFTALGVPAYVADLKAKQLYDKDKSLIWRLCELLGNEIYVDGILQKQVMASKIFADKKLLKRVNAIVHPRLLEDFFEWRDERVKEGTEMIIYESAIFLETPLFHQIADKVIVVTAPEEVRIKRVMKRDNMQEYQVRQRISKQWNDEKRLSMADFIIFADGKRAVLPQILNIIEVARRLYIKE
ncbi:MAG: dephospho-CoA kinase [Bacteroidales bacterium]|nr:dephospho-CoA kinase [Bacteroidales bacterium]MDD2426145.1 dephospho-CoA kinase [Bacteroidales bacterium]MDD3812935.1 dephospho-CoA kinase [Bacteroidales bacterium]MDD3989768.1 dephospho-CoA kinase [Bacteroidales bacterium]